MPVEVLKLCSPPEISGALRSITLKHAQKSNIIAVLSVDVAPAYLSALVHRSSGISMW